MADIIITQDEPDEQVVDAIEETDELIERLTALEAKTDTQHTELIERLEACRNQLEQSSTVMATAENPLLTQALASLQEIKAELTSLKSSMDTMLKDRTPNPYAPPVTEVPEEISVVESTEEPVRDVSNAEPATPPKKNRFI